MGNGRAGSARADEHNFEFDLLDATKIIPEEEIPVRISAAWC